MTSKSVFSVHATKIARAQLLRFVNCYDYLWLTSILKPFLSHGPQPPFLAQFHTVKTLLPHDFSSTQFVDRTGWIISLPVTPGAWWLRPIPRKNTPSAAAYFNSTLPPPPMSRQPPSAPWHRATVNTVPATHSSGCSFSLSYSSSFTSGNAWIRFGGGERKVCFPPLARIFSPGFSARTLFFFPLEPNLTNFLSFSLFLPFCAFSLFLPLGFFHPLAFGHWYNVFFFLFF